MEISQDWILTYFFHAINNNLALNCFSEKLHIYWLTIWYNLNTISNVHGHLKELESVTSLRFDKVHTLEQSMPYLFMLRTECQGWRYFHFLYSVSKLTLETTVSTTFPRKEDWRLGDGWLAPLDLGKTSLGGHTQQLSSTVFPLEMRC